MVSEKASSRVLNMRKQEDKYAKEADNSRGTEHLSNDDRINTIINKWNKQGINPRIQFPTLRNAVEELNLSAQALIKMYNDSEERGELEKFCDKKGCDLDNIVAYQAWCVHNPADNEQPRQKAA